MYRNDTTHTTSAAPDTAFQPALTLASLPRRLEGRLRGRMARMGNVADREQAAEMVARLLDTMTAEALSAARPT